MDKIKIVGAKVHNLKNITVEIPRDKLTVITGISGSGKSSLAFDTIYAEGQRRYVANLSGFAKQFLDVLEKPEIDYAEGLSPALAIDQKSVGRSPRSTVATMTEIMDYLRLLFARLGKATCLKCKRSLIKQDLELELNHFVGKIKTIPTNASVSTPILITSLKDWNLFVNRFVLFPRAQFTLRNQIYTSRNISSLAPDKVLNRQIDVKINDLLFNSPIGPRQIDELERVIRNAFSISAGRAKLACGKQAVELFEHLSCPAGHMYLPELEPRLFSFNSPQGACPDCQGLGRKKEVDPNLVIPNVHLTLAEGAIRPWSRMTNQTAWYEKVLRELALRNKFSVNTPINELPVGCLKSILYGDGQFEGVIPNLERRYHETDSEYLQGEIEKYMIEKICPTCQGKRLKVQALSVKVSNHSIAGILQMSVEDCHVFFSNLTTKNIDGEVAKKIISEIEQRLKYLRDVGLHYLTLDRGSDTLAGGEAQRVRLATQLGSALSSVIYVLDEPSIGLHPFDLDKLIKTLKELKAQGNTVIIVEHDARIMHEAEYIIDIGPGAGILGGEIVAQGTIADIIKSPDSLTGQYLSGARKIFRAVKRRPNLNKVLKIWGAAEHNLKSINVAIPTGNFVCVTGVSGSGKSTLIYDILAKALIKHFFRSRVIPGKYRKITGLENINKAINIDQSPIGRTPRSNLATYTGLFTPIRELFAATREAQANKLTAGHFSFNLRGGRCERCRGDGSIKIEMHFLPDAYVTCEECHGRRYNNSALAVRWGGKSIADILEMTVDQAAKFFVDIPAIMDKINILKAVGLGYVPLGQSATTLSGGEAQRIKLATELSRHDTGKTLYILDEPTTGLHFEDINRLLGVLDRLVEKGNTVLVIEHNLDVIAYADYIIDLGPGGGKAGGQIVGSGTPNEMIKKKASLTGHYLAKYKKSQNITQKTSRRDLASPGSRKSLKSALLSE